MRKLPLLIAVAVTASLVVTGVASAQATQSLTIKAQNNRAGTKAKPRSVSKLTVDINSAPAVDPATALPIPFVTTRTTIFLDKNLVFGGAKFPSCTAAQAASGTSGAAKCRLAKVGGGVAKGGSLVLNIIQDLKVTAFNGPGGRSLYLRVQTLPGAAVALDQVLNGKLQNATGKYGKKLVVDIPAELQNIAGADISLLRFMTAVGGSNKGTPYVGLKGCTGGKLNFKADFIYKDGTTNSALATANCRR